MKATQRVLFGMIVTAGLLCPTVQADVHWVRPVRWAHRSRRVTPRRQYRSGQRRQVVVSRGRQPTLAPRFLYRSGRVIVRRRRQAALVGRRPNTATLSLPVSSPSSAYTVATEELGPGFVNTWVWSGQVNAPQLVNRGRTGLAKNVVSGVYVRTPGRMLKQCGPGLYVPLRNSDQGRPLYMKGVVIR